MANETLDSIRQGTLLFSQAIEVSSPAADQYLRLVHELSFDQVWEQREQLIELVIAHADSYLEVQWGLFKAEYGQQVGSLPETNPLFHRLGYHLQYLMGFLVMPVAHYAISLSRDYPNRWRGEQYGCRSMAFFSEHPVVSQNIAEDLLENKAFIATTRYFRNVIALDMNAYVENEYGCLVSAHMFAPLDEITSGRFAEHWQFIDKRSGYSVLRSRLDWFINDLFACSMYVRALDEAELYPYLAYEVGDNCRRLSSHSLQDGAILPVVDQRWEALFPANRPLCDCRLKQLTEQEARVYPGRVEVTENTYLQWGRLNSWRRFDPDTRLPYPMPHYTSKRR